MNMRILAWMFAAALLQVPSVWADPMGEAPESVEGGRTLSQEATAEGAQKFTTEGNLAVAAALAFVTPRPPPVEPPAPPMPGDPPPFDIEREIIDAINRAMNPSNPFDMPLFPGLPPGPYHPGPEMVPPIEPPRDSAPAPRGVDPDPPSSAPRPAPPEGDGMDPPPHPPVEEVDPDDIPIEVPLFPEDEEDCISAPNFTPPW